MATTDEIVRKAKIEGLNSFDSLSGNKSVSFATIRPEISKAISVAQKPLIEEIERLKKNANGIIQDKTDRIVQLEKENNELEKEGHDLFLKLRDCSRIGDFS